MYVIKIKDKHYRCPDRKSLGVLQRNGKLPEKTRVYNVELHKWDYALNWLDTSEDLRLASQIPEPVENGQFIERTQILSRCGNCNKDFEVQYNFCIYCGDDIKASHRADLSDTLVCSNCGTTHSMNFITCIKCGATLKSFEV